MPFRKPTSQKPRGTNWESIARQAQSDLAASREQNGRMAEALKGGCCWDCTAEDGKINHRCWETERDEALSPESAALVKVRECERKVCEVSKKFYETHPSVSGLDIMEALNALAQARAELKGE